MKIAAATQLIMIALIFIASNCECFLSSRQIIIRERKDKASYLRILVPMNSADNGSNDVNQSIGDRALQPLELGSV